MPKRGKRFAAARAAVPAGVKFAPDEAVKLVKELAFAKFDETVEVAQDRRSHGRGDGEGRRRGGEAPAPRTARARAGVDP